MVLANAEIQDPVERRRFRRYTVDQPAQLRLIGGDRSGRLSDLSETGARFETASPPIEGVSGLLVWRDQEQGCTVIWASEGRCGIRFDRPIPKRVVDESVLITPGKPCSDANFGKIPFGQKRSALRRR